MKKAIKMNRISTKSVAEVFEDFVLSQTAKNLSETTNQTYRAHIHSIEIIPDVKQLHTLPRRTPLSLCHKTPPVADF